MHTRNITLAILASITVGTTLPLNTPTMKQVRGSIKKKGWHLIQCLKGNEACTKTDFLILGASLLFARSSFYAALKIGKSEYKREPENHGDKIKSYNRETPIGRFSLQLNRLLRWTGPGKFPETAVRVFRKRMARNAPGNSGPQTK